MEKDIYKKKLIPSQEFVDKSTGETLTSFIGDTKDKYVSVKVGGVKEVHYPSYFITSLEAMRNVALFLRPSESYKMNQLIWHIGTEMNFVLNPDGTVAQRSDLPEILGISTGRVDVLLAKLIRLNVVYIMSGYNGKKRFRGVMINPHIARRGKVFSTECLRHFYDPASPEYVSEMNELMEVEKSSLNEA